MILLDWLRSHCRLTDTPGVFASQVAERFLIENEGTTESVVAQLVEMGMCPRSCPHAGMTLLVFDDADHSGLV